MATGDVNMTDRDVIVTRKSSVGAFVAGAAIVALIVVGALYYNGYFDRSNSIELNVDIPGVETPSVRIEAD
jgi:hypothetical protein